MKIANVLQYDDFIFTLCAFLDEFKRSDNKYNLLCDEPDTKGDRINLCVLAAVAHKLANDNHLETPEWVNKDFYIMPYPVFSYNTSNEGYRRFLLETTPEEFACRNIYYGENAIERV